MRYVVRNNFFGLDGTSQKQKSKENKSILTTTPGEHDGRQLFKEDGANSLVRRKRSLVEDNHRDITPSENTAADQEEILKHEVCPLKFWDSVDSPASIEQAQRLNAEETIIKDRQSPDLSSTDKVTLNIYDDEVWESPGATV